MCASSCREEPSHRHGQYVCVGRGREEYGGRGHLCEAAHTHEAVQCPTPLVPIHSSQLGPADRQVTVGARGVFKDQTVKGAVHGSQLQLLLLPCGCHRSMCLSAAAAAAAVVAMAAVAGVGRHGAEHVLLVEVQVPAGRPQTQVRDVRREQQLVPAPRVLLSPVLLDQQTHSRALRVPEHLPASACSISE